MLGSATGAVTETIVAPAGAVYDLVSDVTRMGEWSPECKTATWIDGADRATPGARFRGDNRIGPRRWSTICEVTAADPGHEFAFTVMVDGREATRWRYRFEPVDDGRATQVTESFDYVWAPLPFALGNFVLRRGRQLRRGAQTTLRRLKAAAEATLQAPDDSGG